VSVTETFGADVFRVETPTVYVAACPRVMLACERCTLTHNSGCAAASALALGLAVLVGLLVLGLGVGLAAM
jgi:hypothetical protein